MCGEWYVRVVYMCVYVCGCKSVVRVCMFYIEYHAISTDTISLSDVRQVDSASPVSSLRALLTSETHTTNQYSGNHHTCTHDLYPCLARTCDINDVAPPGHCNSDFGACCAHNTEFGEEVQ